MKIRFFAAQAAALTLAAPALADWQGVSVVDVAASRDHGRLDTGFDKPVTHLRFVMETGMTQSASDDRCATALRAIKSLYGKPEGEFGPTLFVTHHLEEVEGAYWQRTVGVERPTPDQVLNALVLIRSWSSEGGDNIDVFDFGLPNNASNYVLSVRFQDDGEVADVSMES